MNAHTSDYGGLCLIGDYWRQRKKRRIQQVCAEGFLTESPECVLGYLLFSLLSVAFTWFSPQSTSAAAGAWHSSGPWSWRWSRQRNKPWPRSPSQRPTTASSSYEEQNRNRRARPWFRWSPPPLSLVPDATVEPMLYLCGMGSAPTSIHVQDRETEISGSKSEPTNLLPHPWWPQLAASLSQS